MNYNQYSYYRANPFHNDGYIPPIAHLNRKKPQYLTELPQGQKHLHDSGRKHFTNLKFRNNIQQQGILASPQKYPYENRIALDKNYFRSLNTIDIQGAYSNSLVSTAVKNRMRAQEALKRQHKQLIDNQFDKYRLFGKSDQQLRRQLAIKQQEKNKQLQTLIYKRDNYHTKQKKQQQSTNRNNSMYVGQLRETSPIQSTQLSAPNISYRQNQRQITSLQPNRNNQHQYSNNEKYAQNPEKRSYQKHQNLSNKNQQQFKNQSRRYEDQQKIVYQRQKNISENQIKRNWTPRRMEKRLSISGPVPKDYVPTYATIGKQQHRRMNPTYISDLSQSFGLTARNIIGP